MREAFKYLTSLLFLAIVVQVGFAGYGAFHAIDKAGKDGNITKKTIENGFDPHGVIGTVILAIMLLLVLTVLAGRLGSSWAKWTTLLLVLGILQMLFAYLGTKSAPVGGFLHGINALAIYAGAALLAHRAWTQRPAGTVAP
jgi:DMSO/TMAO reductase YedYZ heme-binding membrane subunit